MSRRNMLICIALLFGGWNLLTGYYIYLKAEVAQVLLEHAWSRTVSSEEQIKPWPWADTHAVARLHVPKHGIDQIVLAGVTGRTLAFAPGYMLASAQPGEQGSCVISGHRDTHFKFLKDLQVGDAIEIQTGDGETHRYIVSTAEVADTRNTRLQLHADTSRLTLVTCYPFDAIVPGGPLRYVVTADAVWT